MSDEITIPEFGGEMTFKAILAPAMEIAKQGDTEAAQRYIEAYDQHLAEIQPDLDAEGRRSIIMSNLGYYAGYYDDEMRTAVEEVFGAIHPIFGTMRPTPEQAFAMGQAVGEELREGGE